MKVKRTIAAILVNSNQQLVVDEIELPSRLDSGQVLVELISSGICGAQLNEIEARKGRDEFLPHLLGHEGFCKVIDTASDVSKLHVGDFAIMHWRRGSGINSATPEYSWRNEKLNAGWVTTFNMHAVISENRLTQISEFEISPDLLPLLGCALTTAFGIVSREIPKGQSKRVILFGAGGVGLALVATLKSFTDYEIVVIDKDSAKIESAKLLGASKGFVYKGKAQCESDLKEYFGSSSADIALETTGNSSCIELSYELTKEDGFIDLIGVPALGQKSSFYTLPLHYGKVLRGSDGGSTNPDLDIPLLIEFLKTNQLKLDSYPLSTYSLNEINKAIQDIRNGQTGRAVIRF